MKSSHAMKATIANRFRAGQPSSALLALALLCYVQPSRSQQNVVKPKGSTSAKSNPSTKHSQSVEPKNVIESTQAATFAQESAKIKQLRQEFLDRLVKVLPAEKATPFFKSWTPSPHFTPSQLAFCTDVRLPADILTLLIVRSVASASALPQALSNAAPTVSIKPDLVKPSAKFSIVNSGLNVYNTGLNNFDPQFSPNGRYLLFKAADAVWPGERGTFYRIVIYDCEQKKMLPGPSDSLTTSGPL